MKLNQLPTNWIRRKLSPSNIQFSLAWAAQDGIITPGMTKRLYKTWTEAQENARPGDMLLLTTEGILIPSKLVVWKIKNGIKVRNWVKKIWETVK